MDRITEFFPEPSPSSRSLGFELLGLDLKAMTARAGFDGRAEFCNPMGTVQGGYLTAMLDDVMGMLAMMKFQDKAIVSTIDLHTQFLRPVRLGRIEVAARISNLGRSVLFTQATLYDPRGKEAARASASQSITRR